MNPDLFIFDLDAMDNRGELIVLHSLPYSDLTHLPEEERLRLFWPDAPLEFGHTLADQIGGQLDAGFVLAGFDEAPHHAQITSKYMPGYYATRALKP